MVLGMLPGRMRKPLPIRISADQKGFPSVSEGGLELLPQATIRPLVSPESIPPKGAM